MTVDANSGMLPSGNSDAQAPGASARKGFRTFLSAMWIIGIPTVFWIALFEFANYVLFLGVAPGTRVTVALVLFGLFAMVWALVSIAAHQDQQAGTH